MLTTTTEPHGGRAEAIPPLWQASEQEGPSPEQAEGKTTTHYLWRLQQSTDFDSQERKYFDSGDYAMSKAGKSDAGLVGGLGREHPS